MRKVTGVCIVCEAFSFLFGTALKPRSTRRFVLILDSGCAHTGVIATFCVVVRGGDRRVEQLIQSVRAIQRVVECNLRN